MDTVTDVEDLLTVREFFRMQTNPISEVEVYTRLGEYLGKYDVKESVRRFGHRKLYNFVQEYFKVTIFVCART